MSLKLKIGSISMHNNLTQLVSFVIIILLCLGGLILFGSIAAILFGVYLISKLYDYLEDKFN